ncbi:carbohydrate ABC transporter permease [Musicola paradisiaca]|uniref:Binding-protein-dependent transport systems inner membrane component n=1 Tax=Musicola paradisiaca (strain Ech703) TaxID=579405 RepID=C6CDN1_MUSP7|nr:sugar ABC transporter permease [Musicola paradisiaca]ACS85148.1 binding-protein-dependent transport systems inner membrane component [Musicola paradisiaca Ech703]
MSENATTRKRGVHPAYWLAPAISVLAVFFIAPMLLNLVMAFSDMGSNLHMGALGVDNLQRLVMTDKRLPAVLLTTLTYVASTLLLFNLGMGIVLAIATTAIPPKLGALFRGIWFLPRISPSVLYALLWIWAVDPSPHSLINQVAVGVFGWPPLNLRNDHPMALIVVANGLVGASFAMVILTAAIRAIPAHLWHAARVDGAGEWSVLRHVVLPALKGPVRFIAMYQALSLMVTYEYILLITGGGPVYDTTTYALYIYRRAFESGAYGYGAMLALALMLFGVLLTLLQWRMMNMRSQFAPPRIEVMR